MPFTIFHDVYIETDTITLYHAISHPDEMVNWWPLKCRGIPKEGEMYNLNFTDAYDWYGRVTVAEENKSFHIQMTQSDEDWNHTTFGYDLSQDDNGVWLKFSHVGWPMCNQEYRQSSFCWAMLLKGLKDYVEKGIVIPFEDRS